MPTYLVVICTVSITINAIVLVVVGMASIETFARAGRLLRAQWEVQHLAKRNAAQQEVLANSHRNNEALRAELTALQQTRRGKRRSDRADLDGGRGRE